MIFVFLIITASKLLKMKSLTEFDVIRNQDNQLYEPVCNATEDTKSKASSSNYGGGASDPYSTVSPPKRRGVRTEMD